MPATASAASKANPSLPRVNKLLDKSFAVSSYRYNRWSADLDETQSLEDALVPGFWASVVDKIMGQDKLNPRGFGDIVEIRKRDTGLFAEVLIVGIGPGFVKVEPLRAYVPADVAEPAKCPLTTRYNAGKRCHDVVRRSDGQLMSSGHQTKTVAVDWITTHMKAMRVAD
jgi:hypothetical protein